jgi:hypothetical protein
MLLFGHFKLHLPMQKGRHLLFKIRIHSESIKWWINSCYMDELTINSKRF